MICYYYNQVFSRSGDQAICKINGQIISDLLSKKACRDCPLEKPRKIEEEHKMSKIYFDLTRRQYEALLPLREKVLNGHGNDEKGAILLQPVPFPGGHGVTAGFVPHKYAKRISDILLELEKEEKDE